MITKEQIEERKASLVADYTAISGAIQDCDYWLDVLEGASSEAPSELDTVTLDESNTDMEVENGTPS
jgi:hypothetical protein